MSLFNLKPRGVFYVVAAAGIGACVMYILAVGLIVVPAADDYCSLAATRAAGFAEYVRDFYTGFNGRFASGVATAILYDFGIEGFMVVSPLALAVIFSAIAYAFAPLSRLLFDDLLGRSFIFPAALVVGLFVVGSLSYRLPYEYLHWLPGIISYTLPLTLLALMWRFALSSRIADRQPAWSTATVLVVSAFLATFHEFVGVFSAGVACIIFIAECVVKQQWRAALARLVAAVVGNGVGMLSIFFSPGIQARRAELAAILKREIPLSEAVRNGTGDVMGVLQTFQSWNGAFAVATGITFGVVAYTALRPQWKQMLRTRSIVTLVATAAVGALAFLAALWGAETASRLTYGFEAPNRMLVYPYLFLIVELGFVGILIAGRLARSLGHHQLLGYAMLGLIVSVINVGVWRATSTYWDRVDGRRLAYQRAVSRVDEARQSGILRISGEPHIPGLGEAIGFFSDYWLNKCQAEYFEVPAVLGE